MRKTTICVPLLALAVACGEAFAPLNRAVVTVALGRTVVAQGDTVQVSVTLANTNPVPVRFTASDPCYLDFEVRDSASAVVAHGVELCAQIFVGPVTVPAGGSERRDFNWQVRLGPGTYTVRGLVLTLRSSPRSLQVLSS